MARAVRGELAAAAMPELAELADQTVSTAFLVLPSGQEAVTLVAVEPRRSRAHVTHRPASDTRCPPAPRAWPSWPPSPRGRTTLRGALGPPDRLGAHHRRSAGRLSALAAPMRFEDGSVAALCLVFVAGELDERAAVARLLHHARRLEANRLACLIAIHRSRRRAGSSRRAHCPQPHTAAVLAPATARTSVVRYPTGRRCAPGPGQICREDLDQLERHDHARSPGHR